jgi:uncharacterized protein (UPF0332 family)
VGVAEDLLTLANALANPAPTDPEQVWLRRSVSTAYYALFHLLVGEAVQGWSGSQSARLGLERAFQHTNMKEVSRTVKQGSWRGWSTPPPPLPAELRAVATAFIDLQDARHQADYDNTKTWTVTRVSVKIADAESAFENWKKIRTDPAANEYLLSLLIGKKRE